MTTNKLCDIVILKNLTHLKMTTITNTNNLHDIHSFHNAVLYVHQCSEDQVNNQKDIITRVFCAVKIAIIHIKAFFRYLKALVFKTRSADYIIADQFINKIKTMHTDLQEAMERDEEITQARIDEITSVQRYSDDTMKSGYAPENHLRTRIPGNINIDNFDPNPPVDVNISLIDVLLESEQKKDSLINDRTFSRAEYDKICKWMELIVNDKYKFGDMFPDLKHLKSICDEERSFRETFSVGCGIAYREILSHYNFTPTFDTAGNIELVRHYLKYYDKTS